MLSCLLWLALSYKIANVRQKSQWNLLIFHAFAACCGSLSTGHGEHLVWQDGGVPGPVPHGHVPHEATGTSTDFARGVWPSALAQTEPSAAPSSWQLSAMP